MEDNSNKEDVFSSFAAQVLDKVKNESDIEQLNADRKLFRKAVPFGMRNYVASYLVRKIVSGKRFASRRTRQSKPKIVLPADVAVTLFFNVGRSRKVFYKDLIFLIMKNSGVNREDIGEINIHKNYSFVQVNKAVVDTIIEKTNEINYRGKRLVVNLANNKE